MPRFYILIITLVVAHTSFAESPSVYSRQSISDFMLQNTTPANNVQNTTEPVFSYENVNKTREAFLKQEQAAQALTDVFADVQQNTTNSSTTAHSVRAESNDASNHITQNSTPTVKNIPIIEPSASTAVTVTPVTAPTSDAPPLAHVMLPTPNITLPHSTPRAECRVVTNNASSAFDLQPEILNGIIPTEHYDPDTNSKILASLSSKKKKKNKMEYPLLDVSEIDKQIENLAQHALHYPVSFQNGYQQFQAQEQTVQLIKALQPYGTQANPSFYVLLRLAKLHLFARNMNIAEEHSTFASNYMVRALELRPNDGEANFIYGTMVLESGGMQESAKFFDKALAANYLSAYVSKANMYLFLENPQMAQACLDRYTTLVPNDPRNPQFQMRLNEQRFSLWQ